MLLRLSRGTRLIAQFRAQVGRYGESEKDVLSRSPIQKRLPPSSDFLSYSTISFRLKQLLGGGISLDRHCREIFESWNVYLALTLGIELARQPRCFCKQPRLLDLIGMRGGANLLALFQFTRIRPNGCPSRSSA